MHHPIILHPNHVSVGRYTGFDLTRNTLLVSNALDCGKATIVEPPRA